MTPTNQFTPDFSQALNTIRQAQSAPATPAPSATPAPVTPPPAPVVTPTFNPAQNFEQQYKEDRLGAGMRGTYTEIA